MLHSPRDFPNDVLSCNAAACPHLRRPAHFTNFDAKFTALPVETPLEDGADPNCPAPFAGDESAFDHDWEFAR